MNVVAHGDLQKMLPVFWLIGLTNIQIEILFVALWTTFVRYREEEEEGVPRQDK